MTSNEVIGLPSHTMRWLAEIPTDTPVAMLMRHSARPPIPKGEVGMDLPITEQGRLLALQFGAALGTRLRRLHTSPVLRCVQTADALAEGAGSKTAPVHDTMLGEPGAFVLDGHAAWDNWLRLGHEGVMAHLVSADTALPGMAEPEKAARQLTRHMLEVAGHEPGLHVFVTHDLLVTATASRALGVPLGREDWPPYLEAGFFWRSSCDVEAAYRSIRGVARGFDWAVTSSASTPS